MVGNFINLVINSYFLKVGGAIKTVRKNNSKLKEELKL
jgi:hypothetical protein